MADAGPQPILYEPPFDVVDEQVAETVAEEPSNTVDEVLEQAVERAVDEPAEEIVEEIVEPAQAVEEVINSPTPDTVLEDIEEIAEEPTHETVVEETSATVIVSPAHETIVEERPEDLLEESVAEVQHVEEHTDDTSVTERQPAIIVTQATLPESTGEETVTEEIVTTETINESSDSSTSATDTVPSTTGTVVRDGQSTATTEPMVRKTVTFAPSRKPRMIRDRGRNLLIQQTALKILLGRMITDAIGPDIRRMLELNAGKGPAGVATAAA